ncbi:MAG: thioredoxin family protein [Fibromonadaceae bacterium]|jgi:thiol:disulfide interchange protein DsbD|nr:thioredoxin family protein [Fibromonadaceae bacterium]
MIRLFFLSIAFFASFAVTQVPVSLNNMEPPKTKLFYSQEIPQAGDTLYVEIIIPQGWHINADTVPDDFLIPSSIEPVSEGMKFGLALWPEPEKLHNEVLNMDLFLLQDSFVVSLPVSFVSETCNPYDVKLKFTYQACSRICLAPRTIEVSFDSVPAFNDAGATETVKKNFILNKKSFLLYLLLALLGGLLLNVMPCVLPVLFIKVFDLMRKSGETKRNMLKWGLATTGGVLSTFFVIALAILAARLTGHAVGWGFQFQYPAYTAVMALGIAIFALSLWGVFDIWMPGNAIKVWENRAKKDGARGAFAYGILLVLLSTPCSAPFLGTAIGFAFTASVIELFSIFAAVALGLASPYIVLSIFPHWTKKLPQPGHWMLVLKQFLGFPLLLTVVWLFWIFAKQAGASASLVLALLLCLAAFFAWLSGLVANPGKPWWRFVLLWFAFVVFCIFSWQQFVKISDDFVEASVATGWVSFSSKKLDSLQNEGIAVWVNGTADWCITCKVNEKAVFENERVKEAFAAIPIVKMQADYTKPNSEALKFFETYGRSAVPFDLLLSSHGEPILLPEILTPDIVVEVLEKAFSIFRFDD